MGQAARKARSRRCGAPTSEARSTSQRASYRRSARAPSTAPSARKGGWPAVSPRHHGQNSTSPGEPAGEVRRPRTFSITTRQGRRASTARATCSHNPERVWALSPARRPATETSLAGETRRQDAHPRNQVPVDGGDVSEVGHTGPVSGQDAGGIGVDLRMPGSPPAEGGLDAEVQAAVSRAQAADQRTAAQDAHVSGPAGGYWRVPAVRWRRPGSALGRWRGYGRCCGAGLLARGTGRPVGRCLRR